MHDHADLMSHIYFRDWAVLCTLPHYIIGKYEPPARENIRRGLPPGLAPPPGNTTAGEGLLPSNCDSEAAIAERCVN